jgi:hypothetical protein
VGRGHRRRRVGSAVDAAPRDERAPAGRDRVPADREPARRRPRAGAPRAREPGRGAAARRVGRDRRTAGLAPRRDDRRRAQRRRAGRIATTPAPGGAFVAFVDEGESLVRVARLTCRP